jgi:hypothetical protein
VFAPNPYWLFWMFNISKRVKIQSDFFMNVLDATSLSQLYSNIKKIYLKIVELIFR